ncbi:MAG: hypothetical protein ACRELW_08970 [Candidatus Rokuibacteriota bacterium]
MRLTGTRTKRQAIDLARREMVAGGERVSRPATIAGEARLGGPVAAWRRGRR